MTRNKTGYARQNGESKITHTHTHTHRQIHTHEAATVDTKGNNSLHNGNKKKKYKDREIRGG